MSDASTGHGPPNLPVMLRLEGRRCVIVGGGPVAARRAASLVGCGAQVVVVAPAMVEALDELMIERRHRGYQSADLDGAFAAVAATDDPAVNRQVADDAETRGVLVNRADHPGSGGDFTVMGHDSYGPLTIAVDTAQSSAAAGKAIRRELGERLDPDWVVLLGAARPWRGKIQRAVADADERTARLRRLTDEAAMRILKDSGDAALGEHLRRVAEGGPDET